MLHNFLTNNVDELVNRCTKKVAARPYREATERQLHNGIPMFLDQLIRTLRAEQEGGVGAGDEISGAAGGSDVATSSEIGVSAIAHGGALLDLGYTVDQVVHDYGDLCQAITDLALERDAPFSVDEFRTLNRCLDNAIADAVTEFSYQRDMSKLQQQSADMNEKLGFLMHELRNSLSVATLAVSAMEAGVLPIAGATGSILKRSHAAMLRLITESLDEVRVQADTRERERKFPLSKFIEEASEAAQLTASARQCDFQVSTVDPTFCIAGNRDLLLAALANLLHNAFKFTRPNSQVSLTTSVAGDRILIEVKDHCGGLAKGDAERIFSPFSQRSNDKTGVGLGLSIARQSIAADNGRLTVENHPGVGCVFRIDLPRHSLP